MLEAEGRRLAANPLMPVGSAKQWLKKVAEIEQGVERSDYPCLPNLRKAIKKVAKISLSELSLIPDREPLALNPPTPAMVKALETACGVTKACFFKEHTTMSAFLNDLSALVHRYEALSSPLRISRHVFASEDAPEETIRTALRWEKNVEKLSRAGLTADTSELFAVATADRLDLKVGSSTGHLTKIGKRTAEYFDPDLDAVYSLGELHREHGGKLMAKKGEHTYLFWNPSNVSEVWAVAVSQDRRNLLFRRLFHDVIRKRPATLLKAYDLADRLIRSYSPEYERKKLHELLLKQEEVLDLCLEEVAGGVISAMKSPDERRQIEDFTVGRAGGIASELIVGELL